ncbi:hypothetical protein KAI65_05860 [Candidatus Parcubacteria bacterium]|nr:hypothetical protein [Candidatus Parcubacteria bacterium]
MATDLEITSEYAYGSKGIERVIDVTEDCPKATKKRRCIFIYIRDKDGLMIDITRPYEGKKYKGCHVGFRINKLYGLIEDFTNFDSCKLFDSCAMDLGLNAFELSVLIEKYIPK